ncbi:MAG: hypothetical protein AAFY65_10350 [Pseudomonadota bacterium]
MTKTILAIGLGVVTALGGCGSFGSLASGDSGFFGRQGLRGSASEVEGIRFRTRTNSTSDDDRSFTSSTRGAERSLPAAIQAGQAESVRYCLERFGGSEIIWELGPDRELEDINLDDSGALVLTGRCIAR